MANGYGSSKPSKAGYGSKKAGKMASPAKKAAAPRKKMGKGC